MSATVEAAPAKDAAGPIRPPGTGHLGRVPEGFAPFFGALRPKCVLTRVGLASGIAEGFVSVPSQQTPGKRAPEGRPAPASTAALPSLTALGLDGGDEAGRAGPDVDLPEQVHVRHRKRERLCADGTDPCFVGIVFVRLRDRSGGHQLAPPLTYPGWDPADGPSWAGWVESCRR